MSILIEGLHYYPNCIPRILSHEINTWLKNVKGWKRVRQKFPDCRHVVQFGSNYLYDAGKVSASNSAPKIPKILRRLALLVPIIYGEIPDNYVFTQCIINRYDSGESIMPHTDLKEFGPVIAAFTFGRNRIMSFSKDNLQVDIPIGKHSLYVMTESARFDWKHEMLPNENRETIFSITFRCMPEN